MITLPWAVMAQDNHRHVPVCQRGKGRLVTSSKYRDAKETAQTLLIAQWKRPVLDQPLAVVVTLYGPNKQMFDIANRSKMLCDAMTGIVYADDSQIDDIRFVRGPIDRANPRAEIEISLLANPL